MARQITLDSAPILKVWLFEKGGEPHVGLAYILMAGSERIARRDFDITSELLPAHLAKVAEMLAFLQAKVNEHEGV